MAKAKKPGYVYDLVTPKGRLLYPHLAAPNTGGTYPSNKYEVTLIFSQYEEAGHKKLMDAALECAQQVIPDIKLADIDIALRDGDDKKNSIHHGHYVIRAKSNREVPCFDGMRAAIDASTVGHGSFGRLSLTAGFYKKAVDKATAEVYKKAGQYLFIDDEGGAHLPGVTFYLNRVQCTAPNDGSISAGKGSDGSEFPEDEDF